jgi:hypothetical protein
MSAVCFHLEGGLDTEVPEGWERKTVQFRHRDGTLETRVEIIDLETKQRYLNEPLVQTAFKCLGIVIGLPFFTAGYIAYQAVRATSIAVTTLYRATRSLFQDSSLVRVAIDLAFEIPATLIQAVWNSVQAPLYAFPMALAALIGIVLPLQGRVYVGAIEKAWKGGTPIQMDPWHRGDTDDRDRACTTLFTDRNAPYVFYLAACFQSFGRTDDPHVVSVSSKV